MKTYLIDAYNYIFKKIVDNKLDINSGLQKLLVILNELSSKGDNSFIVFIDGGEEKMFNKEFNNKIMCIFSSKKSTADSEIISYIKNNPLKNYVVVTDDVELGKKAKLLKAKLVNCDEFAFICRKAVEIVNESKEKVENESYILLKQNPKISNDEVEQLFKEFSDSEEENI